MAKPDHTLCFVCDGEGQIFLHADSAGLDALISCLEKLKKKTEAGQSDHDHLRTNAWAGSELSEEIGKEEGQVIHHVKIYGWTEAKTKEHGFRK